MFNTPQPRAGHMPDNILPKPRRRAARLSWLLALAVLAALGSSACAGGKRPDQGAGGEPRAADEIAAFVAGDSPSGSHINSSRYGPGAASLGESYFSALGLPCRRVIFIDQNNQRRALSVCIEKNGVWTTAPDIIAGAGAPR